MDDIVPRLEALRQTFPQVGYMLHFGIWDPKNHWAYRQIDIEKQLAAEIIRDELQEAPDLRSWVIENIDETNDADYFSDFGIFNANQSAKVQK